MADSLQMRINTKNGERILEKIYFTELGHLMAKIYDPKSKTWQNQRIGNIETLLNEENIQIKNFITLKPSAVRNLGK